MIENTLKLGDEAPKMYIQKWIKGSEINQLKKGTVYVIDYWATWCRPCKASMPGMSEWARKYSGKAVFIGMDILEHGNTTDDQVQAFAKDMGSRMNYEVARWDTANSEKDWLKLLNESDQGIPRILIVDKKGRIAWTGHPCDNFEKILLQILNGSYDINKFIQKRTLEQRLKYLDDSLTEVMQFDVNGNSRKESWKKDSLMITLKEAAKADPLINFCPRIAFETFNFLIKYNISKAVKYAKQALHTKTYESSAPLIEGVIGNFVQSGVLTNDLYKIGIEALQIQINEMRSCLPEIRNVSRYYSKMGDWYFLIGDKSNAIKYTNLAIDWAKTHKGSEEFLGNYLEQLNFFEKNNFKKSK